MYGDPDDGKKLRVEIIIRKCRISWLLFIIILLKFF